MLPAAACWWWWWCQANWYLCSRCALRILTIFKNSLTKQSKIIVTLFNYYERYHNLLIIGFLCLLTFSTFCKPFLPLLSLISLLLIAFALKFIFIAIVVGKIQQNTQYVHSNRAKVAPHWNHITMAQENKRIFTHQTTEKPYRLLTWKFKFCVFRVSATH